ncbi:unnamed protein product [Candidula unifasciata]|uniref:Cytochrome P450 n=1 Tax=Candidula unifasciata TaxID=100452 RepID=A0A8S3Z7N0_9EUPU|nr:unnamed protein product [Candidula unifasciata]
MAIDPVTETASMSASCFLLLATVIAMAYYYYNQKATQETWIQYGVKEPKLSLLFSLGEDFRYNFSHLLNQYGDTVGLRNKSGLTLLTSNLNLMKHILVKDFNNFVERSDNLVSSSPFVKSLFFAKQKEWKRHRQIVSPTFSSGKLRHIASTVNKSAQSLTDYLASCARLRKCVPIKEITAQYTGEIIAKTAFGLDANFIGQEEHEFLHHAKTMIPPLLGKERLIFKLLDCIPYAIKICKKIFYNVQFFDPISLPANAYFETILNDAVRERKKQQQEGIKKRHEDFLDLLLKTNEAAKQGTVVEEEEAEDDDQADTKKAWQGAVSALSDDEILGHSMLIIFAGMETTATTLQLCLYQLAVNQEIQERVHQEIQEVVSSQDPSQEELSELHYVEQVINETLRLHPPAPLVNRRALETRTYDGVTIPKGAAVILPYYHIMTDPKFDFLQNRKIKRDTMAFIAFGHGPRQCLGMRLAYLELKVALVHILRKVKVILNKSTVPTLGEKIKFTPQGLLIPVKPIMLMFELRG